MIEKTVIDYLNKNMPVSAYMEEPENVPAEYLIIERTGGGEEDGLKQATIAVQSYAGSLYRAAELNEQLKEIIKDIADQNPVSSVELNSDYNFTDEQTKRYRYQAVFDFIYY